MAAETWADKHECAPMPSGGIQVLRLTNTNIWQLWVGLLVLRKVPITWCPWCGTKLK